MNKTFQNWTCHTSRLVGTVLLWLDYRADLDALRGAFEGICAKSPLWNGRTKTSQVFDAGQWSLEVRPLVSTADGGNATDLRCAICEAVHRYLRDEQPFALPTLRVGANCQTPSGFLQLNQRSTP